jgi:hypothetical protein
MRHIVTLSLVFFSLTHLAKAERIEGLRLVTKFCNSQQLNKEVSAERLKLADDQRHPFFLSYSALTSIGLLPEKRIEQHRINNYIIVDLTIKEQTKNNSP